jgi:hypothetical protein
MATVLKDDFATQAGHWYSPDGSPRYTQIAKAGHERPTTLRDAKKLFLLPSVTTVGKVMAAPGLETWKIDQAVMAALTATRNDGEPDKDFIARIKREAQEQAYRAADFGTTIHGQIEKFYRGESVNPAHRLFVDGAVAEVEKHFPGGGWSAERSFASPLGYGGKVDLHRNTQSEIPRVIVDFKGKDGDLSDVKCFDEHYMQGAAYGVGLFYPDPFISANCFFSRTHPGIAKMVIHDEREQDRGWRMFRAALDLWIAQSNYDPRAK